MAEFIMAHPNIIRPHIADTLWPLPNLTRISHKEHLELCWTGIGLLLQWIENYDFSFSFFLQLLTSIMILDINIHENYFHKLRCRFISPWMWCLSLDEKLRFSAITVPISSIKSWPTTSTHGMCIWLYRVHKRGIKRHSDTFSIKWHDHQNRMIRIFSWRGSGTVSAIATWGRKPVDFKVCYRYLDDCIIEFAYVVFPQ